MGTVTAGMDIEEVEELGRFLQARAGELDTMVRDLERMVDRAEWTGAVGQRFKHEWWPRHRGRLDDIAAQIDGFGRSALNNAADQREVSSGGGGGGWGGGSSSTGLTCVDPIALGRNGIADALGGVNGTGRDEIQIRQLANGRYIVVLPGVVDLTEGFESGARAAAAYPFLMANPTFVSSVVGRAVAATGLEWASSNDENSVRDMGNAVPASLWPGAPNPYADRVKEAMQEAGVPEGAEVMLVGHSYGAYTAAHLASDASFNEELGVSGGYHVKVTHLVAAAAETDGYFDRLPEGTRSLVLNNQNDRVYSAENVMHSNVDPSHQTHHEVGFDGGGKGFGHDPSNYVDYIRASRDARFEAFLQSASDYGGPGTATNHKVPDNR